MSQLQGDNKQAVIFQDPKVLVIGNFNIQMQKIYDALTEHAAKGGPLMLAFIMRLKIIDKPEYAKMKKIADGINMEYGINRSILYQKDSAMSTKEIWEIWSELNFYMNSTYFRGFEFGGKPQQQTPGHRL